MTGIAILCSGQGAQGAAMFDLLADAPEAAPVFDRAKAILGGRDPRQLVHQASDQEMHANRLGQILCCTQTMAAWAVIRGKLSGPLIVAGYSVGELGAWGVAGLMDEAEVLRLAIRRAAAMDAATTEPSGLVAIRGLGRDALDRICGAHGAYVAIINASDQMLVGGTRQALVGVVADAEAAGATRATQLAVEVASHTPLLAAASEQFRRDLASAHIAAGLPPDVRLLSGIDGAPIFDIKAGIEKLARQIRQTVDWRACMETCRASNVSKVIELGPGNALARLMQDAAPGIDAHSVSEFHTREGFLHWVGRPAS
jgi:[acyl-carrier-protein] S-malonyltransferase